MGSGSYSDNASIMQQHGMIEPDDPPPPGERVTDPEAECACEHTREEHGPRPGRNCFDDRCLAVVSSAGTKCLCGAFRSRPECYACRRHTALLDGIERIIGPTRLRRGTGEPARSDVDEVAERYAYGGPPVCPRLPRTARVMTPLASSWRRCAGRRGSTMEAF